MKNSRIGIIEKHDGFSLVELLIVMVIFIVVIMISSQAFERIISSASKETKNSDSNVQGIVGLEMMRSDLEHAGFGLPWSLDFTADFAESDVAINWLAKGIDPKTFNDINNTSADPLKVPRAIQSAAATGATNAWENGRDYLVIKSNYVGLNKTAKKFTYVTYSTSSMSYLKLTNDINEDFVTDDRVITLNATDRKLIGTDMTHFSYSVPAIADGKFVVPTAYQPTSSDLNYLVYGVNSASDLAFPYNRVDYYIKRPSDVKDIPSRCAPGTGILYKAHLNHAGTSRGVTQYPLLECIADMQIVYSLDTNTTGAVDFHGGEDVLTGLSAAQIRQQLKEVRVYILTHEGQIDRSYTYPNKLITVGEFGAGRDYDVSNLGGIGTTWQNYRWKLYTLVVKPKNINY